MGSITWRPKDIRPKQANRAKKEGKPTESK
jgi:hypothetical protein